MPQRKPTVPQRNIESASDMVLAMLRYRVAEKYQALNAAIDRGSRAQMRLALTELEHARQAYAEFVAPASTSAEPAPTCYKA